MKIMSVFAVSNAVLGVACALLGAAPFTPAPRLFFVLLPLAAFFARRGHVFPSLAVVGAGIVAGFLSPIRFGPLATAPLVIGLGWLLLWSAGVICFSRPRLRAAMAAARRRDKKG